MHTFTSTNNVMFALEIYIKNIIRIIRFTLTYKLHVYIFFLEYYSNRLLYTDDRFTRIHGKHKNSAIHLYLPVTSDTANVSEKRHLPDELLN